jgi:hypothetical protein
MTYAVVEDIDGRLWIEESCPVGTHYWTVEQAAALPAGARTRRALEEAIALSCDRLSLNRLPTLPSFDEAPRSTPARSRRTASTPDRHLSRV